MIKKKLFENMRIILIILFLFVIFFGFILYLDFKDTYAVDINKTFSREELQEMVVSTALSYFYNKEYVDYEQKGMDDIQKSPYNTTTFFWRNFNVSPEEVNRANKFNTDCSAFAQLTYINTLGYDMSEYYKKYNSTYFENFDTKKTNESIETYKKSYLNYGKGWSTDKLTSIADSISGNSGTEGKEYINNGLDNETAVVYYYKVKTINSDGSYKETEKEQNEIRNNIISILKPGDMLVYRRINKTTGEKRGHCVIYVGSALSIDEKGFIHSSGTDFNINVTPITIGQDTYSIRYDTWDNMIVKEIFKDDEENASYAFSVLRPINTYCDSNKSICTLNIDSNVVARKELSRLRVEAYQGNTNGNFSVYNSVNAGDDVTYNLVLTNKSKFNYCEKGAPSYDSKEKCENAGYKWKQTTQKEITYNNLKVTAKVPIGTNYISCNNNCEYNSATRILTWNISNITPNDYKKITYTVNVTSEEDIINNGFLINTENNNNLQLGELSLNVNPTLNSSINKKVVEENIEKFANLVDNDKIKFSRNDNNYKVNLDDINTANMSNLDFVKSIYYNSFGIDLNYLTTSNLKSALFDNKTGSGYNVYAKKTEDEITNLTDENYVNINKMLVSGMYGGRLLKGNDNVDRARYLNTPYLEFGDIIFTIEEDNTSIINAYIFLGLKNNSAVLVEFNENNNDSEVLIYDKNNSTKTGWRVFKEIFSKDLFFVLRPTKLYGTTVKYDYNTGVGSDKLYVAYNTYKNLIVPTKDSYIVTLNYNDGNIIGMPEALEATNEFVNWYTNSDLKTVVTNESKLNSTKSHTLYAKWKTNPINLPTPTKEGYKFIGWYSSLNDDGVKVSSTEFIPSKNVTLYAKWEKADYTITYNLDGGTNNTDNPNAYVYGDEIILYSPTKIGHKFIGWYSESTFTNEITKVSSTTFGDKILYAKWEKADYTITYNLDGGTNNIDNPNAYVYGDEIILFSPIKIGYKFMGWYTNNKFTSSINKITPITHGDLSLYAKWEKADYTITYNLDGGTNNIENPNAYSYGNEIILYSPTKIGHKFIGWYSESTFTNEITKVSSTTFGDKILYAKWEKEDYTITYYLDDGTNNPDNPSVYTYGIEQLLYNPSKKGYKFMGWYTDEKFTGIINKITAITYGNLSLYAKWEKADYTITYNLDGGTNNIDNPDAYIYGDKIVLYNPIKVGYKFIGWYTDPDFTKEIIEINSTEEENKVLYAKWEKTDYTITYNLNGGTNNKDNIVAYSYGDEIMLLSPTKEGYKFDGWYLEEEFVNIIEKIESTDTGNKIFYAKWKEIEYTITYNLDGGVNNKNNPNIYLYGNEVVLDIPTKEGYKFDGWYLEEELVNIVEKIESTDIGNKTFYAKWIKNETFDNDLISSPSTGDSIVILILITIISLGTIIVTNPYLKKKI